MRLSDKMNCISTNVNLLRFIAAFLVILSHSFYVAASQEDPFTIFCNGQASLGGVAVAIFFFLSGFYVTKSLYRKSDVKDYLYKRCVRIFPQLWIVVFLSMFVLGPVFTKCSLGEYFANGNTYLYALNGFLVPVHNLPGVFVDNIYDATVNGPLWTMSVEFAAYCALALILIISKSILKNDKLQKIFHIICLCVLLAMFVVLDVLIKNNFLITVMRPFIIFFVGVLYCDYSEKIKLNVPVAIVMSCVIILGCKVGFLNYALIACLPYIVVTLTLRTKQVKFDSRILLISYEMYLLGWPIQQIVVDCFGGEMNPWLNCFITLPIDILLAYVLYICVEKNEKKQQKKGT